MRTAIIATVRNEAERLPEFLASLERQTRAPDVVVVTDGGSTDATPQLLEAFAARTSLRFRWLFVAGNRSVGRNAAIREAQGDVIAATDVSVLEPTWFERIVEPLERGEADIVGGWYELLVETPRERALGLLTQWSLDQVRPETFLPSSRSVAFTRAAWERVGGYPEDLATTEDTVFDLRLRAAGLRFAFRPDAVVRWRPATDAAGTYRMHRAFAETDAHARLFFRSPSRYPFVIGAYVLADVLLLAGFLWPILWALLLGLAVGYLVFRVRKVLRAGLVAQVPYAMYVAVGVDMAMFLGYIRGVRTRQRTRTALDP